MTRSWKNTSGVMKSPGIFCIPVSGNAENGNYKIYLTRNRPNSARTFQASSGVAVASVRLQADRALWTDWTCTWVRCHGNRRASGKPGLSPAISYLDKSHAKIVLNRHVSFTRICECYTFRVFSAKYAYRMFFSTQNGIFDGNFNIICVSITYFIQVSLPRPSGCQQNGTIRVSEPPWNETE